jgi:hypothetical protein
MGALSYFMTMNKGSTLLFGQAVFREDLKEGSRKTVIITGCIYTITKDFKTFGDTKLFLDPGFSVIDAVIVKRATEDYVLVLKDNTRPERDIKVAFSNSPIGPWQNISKPFTDNFTEGPSL